MQLPVMPKIDKGLGVALIMGAWFWLVLEGRAPVTQFIDTLRDLMWGLGFLHGAAHYQKVQGGGQ